MFSMNRTKSVVSFIYDLAIGCKSKSMKLEIRSEGPPLPETTDRSADWVWLMYFCQCIEFRYSGWNLALIEPFESHCVNMVVFIQCIDYVADLLGRRGHYRIL